MISVVGLRKCWVSRSYLIRFMLISVGLGLGSCGTGDHRSRQEDTFLKLEQFRDSKKAELTEYFEGQHSLALSAARDTTLLQYFVILLRTDATSNRQSLSHRLGYEIDRYYVNHYGDFYDLLFVDSTGFVFYSIRQESDFETRLITDTVQTRLGQQLLSGQGSTFVDFEYYDASREPASFHVIPVEIRGIRCGWLVFQTPINILNTILTDHRGLGRTGEVYLVNGDRLMLSDSRFISDGTILRERERVVTDATRMASSQGAGHALIEDYRGVTVLSAYDRCKILGNEWIIIAEMDEAEVITDYYRSRDADLGDKIATYLLAQDHRSDDQPLPSGEMIRVDMGEYGKAIPGQLVRTLGVTTCTSIAVSIAGRFAYLAHLAPTDDSYTDQATRLFLEGRQTDLLGSVVGKIRHFDIFPYELADLQFVVVATHDHAFRSIVDRLVENNIQLVQIKILLNPQAHHAEVTVDPDMGQVFVNWCDAGDRPIVKENSGIVPDLMSILKQIETTSQ